MTLRIVTLGDSLTVGYQTPSDANPDGEPTPYGQWVQELIGPSAEVIVSGVNGELTGEMAFRLARDVIAVKPDVAVILGGSNDLGWHAQPAAIMRNLVTMYERCRSAGITPVAVTVPSIRGADTLIPARRALNQLILDYGRSRPQLAVDLFTATAEPETHRLAERYSNDGLHLTTEGYRVFAELVSRAIASLAAR
ncbi:MAG TPA: GDSL-type esterase/lipase family protein [Nitrospiria bacterium]|nr:GDSL-type esterase/lipase family protein [Nitrospiria bacterium]